MCSSNLSAVICAICLISSSNSPGVVGSGIPSKFLLSKTEDAIEEVAEIVGEISVIGVRANERDGSRHRSRN